MLQGDTAEANQQGGVMDSWIESDAVGTATTVDRRLWGRFVADLGDIRIHLDDGLRLNAEVLDESFGGIGLLLEEGSPLEVGSEVSLFYDGTPMRGVVRNVRDSGDGKIRIGVEWITTAMDRSTRAAESCIEERLFLLFHMWEARRWRVLADTARQLMRDAQDLGRDELAGRAEVLHEAVQQEGSERDVHRALRALVDAVVCCPA